MAADQLNDKSWQSLVLTFGPAELDCEGAPFDMPGFIQAEAERCHQRRKAGWGAAA